MSFKYVKIYYGPCESFHTVAHKPQKLRGLRDRLQKLGYRVDLAPVNYVNYCMIEMCGHEVFRCNIQNLRFNTSYHLDPVCQRAIDAVEESTYKFTRARSYLTLRTLLEEQIFRSEYGPREYWPSKIIEINKFETCSDCVKCCGMLVSQKK